MKKINGMKIRALVCACAAGLAVCAAEKPANKGAFGTAFADLAGEDQAAFVAMVNKSMANDEKAPLDDKRIKTLYRVNRDAVKGAPAADRKTVLAEVFATAPMACMPYFCDRFAAEVLNRSALGSDAQSDEDFVEFASAALLRISNRLRSLPSDSCPGARSALAVVTFLKASGGQPAGLREQFMLYVLTGSHDIARKEWIPAAMGDNDQTPSYDSIVQAGAKGEEPAHPIALPNSSLELMTKVVGSDLRVGNANDTTGPGPATIEGGALGGAPGIGLGGGGVGGGGGHDAGVSRVPRVISDKDSPWYSRRRGEGDGYVGQSL